MHTHLVHRSYLALGLALLTACGAARNDADDSIVNPSLDAGDDVVLADAADGSLVDDAGTTPFDAGSPWDQEDLFPDDMFPPDPDCGDASIPSATPKLECDPLADVESSGCEPGQVCFLYDIPANSACEPSSYGTSCGNGAGVNSQGEPCDYGCQAGLVCAIAGAGRQCMKLCRVSDLNGCDEGLVCMPLRDLPGIGVCT